MQDAAGIPITLRPARTGPERAAAFAVRFRVFVEEQGVPADLERDALDASAYHIVAEAPDGVAATGRLVVEAGEASIGRIAVLPEWRGRGIASRVVAALEAEAASRGVREISLHAQTYVEGLYRQLGYEVCGPRFLEAGIDHVPMIKRL